MAFKFRDNAYNVEKSSQSFLKSIGYTLGKTIGQGTYSKVCIATRKNLKVACKIINRKNAGTTFNKKFLPRELRILAEIKHPNIVTIHDILDVNNIVYIFMDFCRNGDLLDHIKNNGPLNEGSSKNYFRQITSAIEYLHVLDIAHRDLKCENIFLTSLNKVKLGDFGFSRRCKNELGEKIFSETYCGSAAYAAPEILQGIAYDPKMIDVWAMGCILFIMLAAAMPFDDTNIKKMVKVQQNKIQNNGSMNVLWYKISQPLKDLLSFILEPNVAKRATIQDIQYSTWLLKDSKEENQTNLACSNSFSRLHVLM